MIVATLSRMAVERRGPREWVIVGPAGERPYKTRRAALAALAKHETPGAVIEFHDGSAAGDLIKRAKAHGFGAAQIAEALGVSRRTVDAWQHGQNKIPGPARKMIDHLITKGNDHAENQE